MILTGKCKEDFDEWYLRTYCYRDDIPLNFGLIAMMEVQHFYSMHLSMQYGVYVDFFDSVGIEVVCFKYNNEFNWFIDGFAPDGYAPTRHEARTKAVEKANQLYNEK